MLYQCVTDYAVLTEQVHMMKRHVQHRLMMAQMLKIIGKEFQKIVIRRYLERSIQKIFFQLTLITNKDYFSRKNLNLRKFTVAVCVIYIYGRDVTHWCQL